MKKLIPPFLKTLDKHLLLNYPVLWVSRIHYVVFIGIIMSAFSALVGLAIPLNTNHTQDLGLWYFLFTLLAIVAFCFWIYRNVAFNIEKKFGRRKWVDEYKLFFLNFTCILIFCSFPFLFTGIYNYRVATIYSNEEFIDDINHMNIAEAYVINNINDYQEYYDSVKQTYSYDLRNRIAFETHTPWELKDDTTEYPNLLTETGLKKIYKQRHTEQEIKFYIQHYMDLYKKYGVSPNEAYDSADHQYQRYLDLLNKSPLSSNLFSYNNYNDYELRDAFNNIARAKYRPLFIWDKDFLYVIFYTCLYLSLLIMLFKMVHWKQFLLTLLSLIIIPIILFIVSQLMPYSDYSDRGDTYTILLLLTLGVAVAFTLAGIGRSKRFNAFKNICAQIVYLAMPVLPLVIMMLCRPLFYDYDNYDYAVDAYPTATEATTVVDSVMPSVTAAKDTIRIDSALSNLVAVNVETAPAVELASQNSYYNSAEYKRYRLEHEYWDQLYEKCLLIATYGGLLLFILVIMPLMKRLFIKQLALPRKS